MSSKENVSKLVNLLRTRLSDNHRSVVSKNEYGVIETVKTSIFGEESLKDHLELSLSEFNQFPSFTNYTFEDDRFVNTFADLLVEGALLNVLAAQSLLERGREWEVNDRGISFVPPSLSDLLAKQHATLLQHHFTKLKHIKSAISDFSSWQE